jgi:hypothetical protein
MMVVLDHLTHNNLLIPAQKMNWFLVRAHGITEPNSHTDMRRIKRGIAMCRRLSICASASIFVRAKAVKLKPPNGGTLARRHLVPFGFSGPVFDSDLICFVSAGPPFDLI